PTTLRAVTDGPTTRHELAYYTIADAPFFPGLVALLDSLRHVGEESPLYVVDCGLTTSQKQRLSGKVTLVPQYRGLHPVLHKATVLLPQPAGTMVVIDA